MRSYAQAPDRESLIEQAKEMMLAGQKRWEVREYILSQVRDEALAEQIMKAAKKQEGRESRSIGRGEAITGGVLLAAGALLAFLSYSAAEASGSHSFMMPTGLILGGIVVLVRGFLRSLTG
ncbi:hypothetical protein [Chitinilyticum piscinae]|uniref:DUF2335 domain-containing protein n=1 Tax=Chitinilyticum piscinae TaxID=2866724 RepID=A0A8J7FL04_9NEIS|nr:hypothetical protein [Chitinilyticum piscinae]MBE9608354.1 hypothetical protein [Chitinilyticum piscinae]